MYDSQYRHIRVDNFFERCVYKRNLNVPSDKKIIDIRALFRDYKILRFMIC